MNSLGQSFAWGTGGRRKLILAKFFKKTRKEPSKGQLEGDIMSFLKRVKHDCFEDCKFTK